MSLIRRALAATEHRVLTLDSVPAFSGRIPPNSIQGGTDAGEYVTDRSALQLIAVQACVRLLADSVSSLPLDGYRKAGDLRVELDPQPSLVTQPFIGSADQIDTFTGLWQIIAPLAMRGESVSVITDRNAMEFPTALAPLDPAQWSVQWDYSTGSPVKQYRVGGQKVDTADILHIKRFALPGDLHGLSPIGAARMGIGLGLAAERYGAKFFGDASDPRATLTTEQDLGDDQVKQVQANWVQSQGGRRLPAVLSGGFEYKAISITPEESQFLETRKFQRSEIAMLFGVPPHMIGDTEKSTSWGTGIEQQSIGFVTYTLRPWLTCLENAFSSLMPRGQYVRFNVDALLRGDTKSRYDAYTQARNAGWLNVDEIRGKEDMPPIPDGAGQSYIQPLNMGPLGSDPLASKEAPQ